MADATPTRTAPYITYSLFDNFISGLSEFTVPPQIDTSLLRNMSGSNQSGLIAALRFLGLTDEKNNTKPGLEKLVHSSGPERADQLRGILTGAYGFLRDGKFDLKRATPAQLAEAIGSEGATGGTRVKSAGFFLKAATAAGLEISPHILKHKHARATPSSKRAKRTASNKPKNSTPGIGTDDEDDNDDRSSKKLSELVLAVLDADDLPEEVEAAIWTMLKYLRKEGR